MGLFQNQGSLGVSFLAFLTTKEFNLFFLVTKFQFFKNSTKKRGFWSKMFPSLPKCSPAVPAVPAQFFRSGIDYIRLGNKSRSLFHLEITNPITKMPTPKTQVFFF